MRSIGTVILTVFVVLGGALAPVGGATSKPDLAAGKALFAANCATCHGATGGGPGIGVNLKNELTRKDLPHIVAWIKNPAPPHPRLYPSPLSANDANNVAAFVATLK